MVMEYLHGKMEVGMREIGKMVMPAESVNISIQMEQFIKVHFQRMKPMDMELRYTKVEIDMLETGKMERNVDKENIYIPMVKCMKANIMITKNMG